VQGDLQRLQQAVASVVSNAIQYTNSGGVTTQLGQISATETDCLAQIVVQDSGVGLSESELDHLFKDLEEVHDEDFEEEKPPLEVERCILRDGVKSLKLGLGLALVARFVKSRNGQIRITSTKGKGSTITLELPFRLCSEAAHPFQSSRNLQAKAVESPQRRSVPVLPKLEANHLVESSARSQSYFTGYNEKYPIQQTIADSPSEPYPLTLVNEKQDPGGHLTVLVADDNSVNLQILQRRLEKMGHDVQVSWDGQECFDLLKAHQNAIDFVLMDLEVCLFPILNDLFTSSHVLTV